MIEHHGSLRSPSLLQPPTAQRNEHYRAQYGNEVREALIPARTKEGVNTPDGAEGVDEVL
jgi:hypothetical protein